MKYAENKGLGIDDWSGDLQHLIGYFPDLANEPVDRKLHEHWSRHGGNFMHSHPGGTVPHQHTHEKCEWCR